MDDSSECKPCAKGVPMWMATFSDMAILLMAFFVLLIAFNDTEMAGAQMITGKFDDKFGVQNTVPVVERPKGNNVLTRSFSPSHVKETIDQVVQEVTTDIRPELDNVLTRYNREKMYRKNSQVEQLKSSLAEEIAYGQVNIIAGIYRNTVEVPTESVTSRFQSDTYENKGFKVSEEDVQLYAQVAMIQATTEKDLEIRYIENLSSSINQQFEFIRQSLISEIKKGQVEVVKKNDQVIIRLADQGAFASGSASLKPGFKRTLSKVGDSLKSNQGDITVEGHTDNVPMAFNDQFRNNWDLSAARAASVVDFLIIDTPETQGKIMASGLGDIKPITSNNTAAGRSRNRRIEIVVSPPISTW
ncbi:OmpA family protein [Porticoccaceae bacterium]|nr:OmpA family protein [Porticoccaceae bacterium]MDA8663452.1 OmpA family protein [Porticoccaceae bacterium]MDA8682284.1 OmpA family protein [Porticoccaceae bacterium]MDB2343812.1 OmpA family protein [Porticoccaceae bacterium]